MANSVDPDQTASSGAVSSGSALFAYAIIRNFGVPYGIFTTFYSEWKISIVVLYPSTYLHKISGHINSLPDLSKHLNKCILVPLCMSKNCWMTGIP